MKNPTRRDFLKSAGALMSSTWIAAQWPMLLALGQTACTARDAGAAFENFSAEQAAVLEAATAQIIPTDDTPGAREAGVIYFVDAALGSFMAGAAGLLREGVTTLNTEARAMRGRRIGNFSELEFSDQTEVLRSQDKTPFFGTLHFLTTTGMFAMPKHGGNRDHIGWELLGFDHRHGWQPPFGFYDAEQNREASDNDKV